MIDLLNPELQKRLRWTIYRYRFLFKYILIGFFSIALELTVLNLLNRNINFITAQVAAVSCSIIVAFLLNVRFNFKVPKAKRNKAFVFFVLISMLSFGLSFLLKRQLLQMSISYELSRFFSSGGLFFVGYCLHRRFSFKEFKKVGVAVYAHGNEDIRGIWEKIKFVGDFIHVDIVDDTFKKDAPDPATYRLEAVKAYWPNKEIHCHVMSRNPSKWIEQVIEYVDTVIVHFEIDEDLGEMLEKIKSNGARAGVCLRIETPVEVVKPYIDRLDEIMLLAISIPGESGQMFSEESLARVEETNALDGREQIELCVDGGINERTVQLLEVEKVVSGSYVIGAKEPMQKIMQLQTSSQYEVV